MGAVSRWLVPAIGLGVLLNPLNSSMIAVAVPRLEETFGLGFAEISWVIVIFYLVSAVAQPLMGRVSDVIGRRRVFIAGLITVFATSVAAACSTGFIWLLVFRGLQAFGTSMVISVGLSIIRLSVTERKARAAAAVSVFLSGAAAFGPAVGGFLLHWSSWPSLFWINIPFVAASFALAVWAIPRDEPLKMAPASAAPFRLFLRTRPLLVTNAEYALVNLVYYAFFFGFPSYLQELRRLDPLTVGVLMLILGVTSLAASALTGRWVERAGPRPAKLASGVALTLGCSLLAFLGPDSSFFVIVIVLVLLGVAGGINNVALQVSLFRTAPPAISGLASGLFLTSRYAGTISASLVLDLVFPQGPTVLGMLLLSFSLVVVTLVYLTLELTSKPLPAPELVER